MNDASPYVGPVPYERKDRDLFFGRDEEAESLLSLLISERVVLFYAQSGAGKSSILNAAIIACPITSEHSLSIEGTRRRLSPARIG